MPHSPRLHNLALDYLKALLLSPHLLCVQSILQPAFLKKKKNLHRAFRIKVKIFAIV
jgi:hypothetical protein